MSRQVWRFPNILHFRVLYLFHILCERCCEKGQEFKKENLRRYISEITEQECLSSLLLSKLYTFTYIKVTCSESYTSSVLVFHPIVPFFILHL